MNKIFHVLSSNGETFYKVIFELSGNRLTVRCDCEAGRRGKLCKHKSSLLSGKFIDSDDYREVMSWVRQSPIYGLLVKVAVSEEEIGNKKKELEQLKNSLEKALKG